MMVFGTISIPNMVHLNAVPLISTARAAWPARQRSPLPRHVRCVVLRYPNTMKSE